jgi:ketosteroid isomerase-like protein
MRTMNLCGALVLSVTGLACERQTPSEEAAERVEAERTAEAPAMAEPTTAAASKSAEPERVQTLEGEALANQYVGCWNLFNQKDWEKFGECYDEKAISRSPDSGRLDLTGRKSIVDVIGKEFTTAFTDAKAAPEIVLVNGRHISTIVLVTGTHRGAFKTPDGSSIPATSKQLGQHVFHAVTFDAENQVTEETLIVDNGALMAQLGLSDSPGRGAEVAALAGSPNIIVAKNDADEKANVDLVKKSWEDFQREDVKALEAVMADDILEADQAATENLSGKQAVVDASKTFFAAMGSIRVTCPTVWGAGPYVVSQCNLKATNDGNMGKRFKKTGKSVDLTTAEVWRLEDGKVKEVWRFLNGTAFSTQLGLVPPVAEKPLAEGAAEEKPPTKAVTGEPPAGTPKDRPAAGNK